MKRIIIIVLSVVFIFLVGAIVLPFVIDLNKYKGKIIDIAKPHLARDLDFGNIELTILKGLGAEIQGLRIAENPEFGKGDFLNLEHLRIKIKLFPLLKKQIQVKELILDKPVVRLIKNAEGKYNFEDLTGSPANEHDDTDGTKKKDGETEKGDGKTEKKNGNALFAGLMVSKFTLNQGKIDFIDEFIRQGTTVTNTIDLLDIQFTDVALDNPIHMHMAARIPEGTKQNLTIKGTMGPLGDAVDMKQLFMDITLRSESLNPDFIMAFYPSIKEILPEDVSFSGLLGMEMIMKGNIAHLQAQGNMEMKDLDIQYGETFHKPKLVPCQISIKASKAGDDIQVDPSVITMHNMSLKTSGKITGLTNPNFDLAIGTDDTSMKGWELLVPSLKEYEPDGNFTFRGSMKGTLGDLSANLQFSAPRLSVKVSQATGSSKDVAPSKSVFEFMDMKVQAEKKNNDIKGSGNLEIKRGEVMAAAFDKMQAQFDYQNDVLGIHGFQAHAFQGDISMEGKVKPSKLRWIMKPVITNINMAEVVDTFTQYKGLFKGIFSGSFTANSSADDTQKGAIDATGSFRLDHGEIMNVNLVDTVMESLFGIKGVSMFAEKEGSELEKQKITRFDSMDGDFSMTRNKINLKKVALHNIHTVKITETDAFIDGLVDCNADKLNLKGKIVLSQEYSARLAKKTGQLTALLNPESRMVLPISITGSLSKPVPVLDIPYVTTTMAKYYGKRELEKLGDKIGLPKKGDKDKQGKESPIGNILKDLIK
ncbi:hypothetical protein BROC_00184 [Candidatus Brocadiaceae bacterium]|nr:hypothetical protein BROC_00184 [Candidatus Brocadiaceae bacterium]